MGFPQVISKVLSEHGSDIDAAVRKLNELQLSMQAAPSTDDPTPNPVQQPPAGAWHVCSTRMCTSPPTTTAPLDAWVDSLLQQLSSVTDMDAARAKATETLTALVASTTAPEVARLQSQLVEAGKENTILKRAVAIQANRLQELGAKDAEVCVCLWGCRRCSLTTLPPDCVAAAIGGAVPGENACFGNVQL